MEALNTLNSPPVVSFNAGRHVGGHGDPDSHQQASGLAWVRPRFSWGLGFRGLGLKVRV